MAHIAYLGKISQLTERALEVITAILDNAGIESVLVTNTTRTPEDQARVMYANLVEYGAEKQRRLYKEAGNRVIDLYEQLVAMDQSAEWIRAEMARMIRELGPSKVSHHCVDEPDKSCVFDIDPKSIPDGKKEAFKIAVSLCLSVDKFLHPAEDPADHPEDAGDPAYHLEISFKKEIA